MPYGRARQIEQRFQRVVKLIQQDSMNAKKLAESLGISEATIHRFVTELRRRGYVIRSVHEIEGWRYEIASSPPSGDDGGKV